jgi:hypothetical protein
LIGDIFLFHHFVLLCRTLSDIVGRFEFIFFFSFLVYFKIPQTGEYIFTEQYNKRRKGKKDPVVFFVYFTIIGSTARDWGCDVNCDVYWFFDLKDVFVRTRFVSCVILNCGYGLEDTMVICSTMQGSSRL